MVKAAGSSRLGSSGPDSGTTFCMFSPAPPFCFYHQLYSKNPQFTLRKSEVVCGPTQRLPAALLSGLGKALTSKSIKHVFPVGGTPLLDLY